MITTSAAAGPSSPTASPHIQQLTEDMLQLAETIAISEEGKQLRENLLTRVQGILNTEWPKEAKI